MMTSWMGPSLCGPGLHDFSPECSVCS